MRNLLAILAATVVLVAVSAAQTTFGPVQHSNGVVIRPGNFTEANASNWATAIAPYLTNITGGSSDWNTLSNKPSWISTNTTTTKNNLGLGTNDSPAFTNVYLSGELTAKAVTVQEQGITFEDGGDGVTRTNLGLGASWLTNPNAPLFPDANGQIMSIVPSGMPDEVFGFYMTPGGGQVEIGSVYGPVLLSPWFRGDAYVGSITAHRALAFQSPELAALTLTNLVGVDWASAMTGQNPEDFVADLRAASATGLYDYSNADIGLSVSDRTPNFYGGESNWVTALGLGNAATVGVFQDNTTLGTVFTVSEGNWTWQSPYKDSFIASLGLAGAGTTNTNGVLVLSTVIAGFWPTFETPALVLENSNGQSTSLLASTNMSGGNSVWLPAESGVLALTNNLGALAFTNSVPSGGATLNTPLLADNAGGSAFSTPTRWTVSGGTVTSNSPALKVSQTWSNPASRFTSAVISVSNAASTNNSLILDLQTNGVSAFAINNAGEIGRMGSLGNLGIGYGGAGLYFNGQSAGRIGIVSSGTLVAYIAPADFGIAGDAIIRWDSAGAPSSTAVGLALRRQSNNILLQHNGTNAQMFRIAGNYTNATNNRVLAFGHDGTNAFIRPESSGPLATNNIIHISGLPTTNTGLPSGVLWVSNGVVAVTP